MTQPPPYPPYDQQPVDYQGTYSTLVDRDTEHLKILSICWYVVSGLALLISCFPGVYLFLGIMFLMDKSGGPGAPPPPMVGWMLVIVSSGAILYALTGAILGFITAYSLPKRRRRALCFTAAGMACLQIPFGVTLAVFTFIVLSRPSIRMSFQ